MMPKFKQKSPVDSIIVDMILDHYNIQNLSGKKENLTGEDFNNIFSCLSNIINMFCYYIVLIF